MFVDDLIPINDEESVTCQTSIDILSTMLTQPISAGQIKRRSSGQVDWLEKYGHSSRAHDTVLVGELISIDGGSVTCQTSTDILNAMLAQSIGA